MLPPTRQYLSFLRAVRMRGISFSHSRSGFASRVPLPRGGRPRIRPRPIKSLKNSDNYCAKHVLPKAVVGRESLFYRSYG